ncbi:TfoX/Sxy family DNA transformation protein [uncultured Propionibacterium sp.]|uniref:TfoX/Sxy family DNA transformation protein n=1 Tax=uncultured Propionibacterium sp. TaxID=218066 RepID=UPI00293195A5|nr:TfoX/Sxy family DNA transformation protein [uncultured Propionibacterium sp.]
MTDLTDLPNIGPRLARALVGAGVDSPRALREIGSVEAWRRIHPAFDCLHSLLSLEAAVRGIPKSQLDELTRQRLRNEARSQ